MKKKANYVVQLRFIDADGDISSWEGFMVGPTKSTELQLMVGVTEIIACTNNMDPKDVAIIPGSFYYSHVDAK